MPEIIVVSGALEGTFVNLDGKSLQEEQKRKINGSAWSTERKYMRGYKGTFWCLLWNRAQIEEGGSGGKVQQRGQGRMEVCG